jgi:hypothetical protein
MRLPDAARTLLLAALAAALASCSNSRMRENVYEGMKSRERIVEPIPEMNPPEQLPPYPEYEAERNKLKAPERGEGK